MKSVRRPAVALSTTLALVLIQAVADPTGLLALVGWSGAQPRFDVGAWPLAPYAMFVPVVLAVTGWAAHLVFNPLTWLGIVLAGVSVVLFGASATMRRRGIGIRERTPRSERKQVEAPKRERAAGRERLVDDDVTAILKKHGIT